MTNEQAAVARVEADLGRTMAPYEREAIEYTETVRRRREAEHAAWKAEQRTPGQAAYERDLIRHPTYHDGRKRPTWPQLPSEIQADWERLA